MPIGAAAETAIPYIRYERASQAFTYDNMTMVSTYEEAAEVAAEKKGVIMLTTGSKNAAGFYRKAASSFRCTACCSYASKAG